MTVNILQQICFFQFLAAIDSDLAGRARIKGCSFCGGVLHSACYTRKPRESGELETAAATTRYSFCCDKCRRRTTPKSVRSLGRRLYPGFFMVLLGAMQSVVTDNMINQLRLSLGVAAYIVANELNRTLHRARCPNAVGAVPTVSGTTFKAWRDYAE
jgi:hypothetical protein